MIGFLKRIFQTARRKGPIEKDLAILPDDVIDVDAIDELDKTFKKFFEHAEPPQEKGLKVGGDSLTEQMMATSVNIERLNFDVRRGAMESARSNLKRDDLSPSERAEWEEVLNYAVTEEKAAIKRINEVPFFSYIRDQKGPWNDGP